MRPCAGLTTACPRRSIGNRATRRTVPPGFNRLWKTSCAERGVPRLCRFDTGEHSSLRDVLHSLFSPGRLLERALPWLATPPSPRVVDPETRRPRGLPEGLLAASGLGAILWTPCRPHGPPPICCAATTMAGFFLGGHFSRAWDWPLSSSVRRLFGYPNSSSPLRSSF